MRDEEAEGALTISGTLTACHKIRRRLLIFGDSISLRLCMNMYTNSEDRRIRIHEVLSEVSGDRKGRKQGCVLDQLLEDIMRSFVQPPAIVQYAELLGFGEIGKSFERDIEARLGVCRYTLWNISIMILSTSTKTKRWYRIDQSALKLD